ncbi:MAG: ABC transporter ATP-binding protein [Thermodesulfobacteriota bacterium]
MNEGSPSVLEAIGLEKGYLAAGQRLAVLSGLDLVLAPGEMVAIVGASGSGKTTLLHILGTLDRPDRGRILHQGMDVSSMPDEEQARFRNQRIGFVFQFHHLLPEFSALENVLMPGLISGRNRGELDEPARRILDEVGLGDRLQHKVGELSGGEQQRVALARALVLRPTLLLADEPTGNLDNATGRKVFGLIRELNRQHGVAVVMVTHNLELATRTDRCLTLAEGRLQ